MKMVEILKLEIWKQISKNILFKKGEFMMNVMMDALCRAGLINEQESSKEYEKFSDVKLPFGSCTSEDDSDMYSEHAVNVLKNINYIRNTARQVTKKELFDLCPVLDKNDKNFKFLLDNVEKVRFVNGGSIHRVSRGYLGQHSREWDYERDTTYGFADVVMMFYFDMQQLKVVANVDLFRLNWRYQNNYRIRALNCVGKNHNEFLDKEDYLTVFKEFLDEMEFIPFTVLEYDGVRISHKAYKDDFGCRYDAFTSPALGINIRKHSKVMEGLKDFFANGGVMKDGVFYLICEDRNKGKDSYYLKRYLPWSPRPAGK